MKYFVYLVGSFALAMSLFVLGAAVPVRAETVQSRLTGGVGAVAGDLKDTGSDLPTVVGGIINVALSVLGSLLFIYIIYAGFLWMTAEGDTKKVDKARDILKQAIIGLVIIVAAFAISTFVTKNLGSLGTGTQSG